MVWPVQLTRCLVFDIGIARNGVMCAAHVALGFGDFGLWNSHFLALSFFANSDIDDKCPCRPYQRHVEQVQITRASGPICQPNLCRYTTGELHKAGAGRQK